MSRKIDANEYVIYEDNGHEYTFFGVKCSLHKDKATFWYWRKNLDNRWELVSFERDGVESISLVIDGEVEGS